MNSLHLMKKVAIAILCVSSVANSQDRRFAFKGNAAEAAPAGISTATARQNTGWTSNGTLARDTLATNYALFGAKTFGVGGTTQAQNARAKFNVLGRAANDTLAIWSNDGGGVVGDSAIFILGNGSIKSGANYLNVSGQYGMRSGNLIIENVTGIRGTDYGQFVNIMGHTGGIAIASANSRNILLTPAAQLLIGASTKSSQAYTTINSNGTADTTFMVRNNKASGTDSTVFFTATGDIDAGGNNFYLGGHRIRSNAAGDSLIFYDGNTMIFAILSDGSTADLVAGTPPTLWRNIPPQEYIWLLRLGVLLLLLLVAFKVYDYAKPRIRKHQTLPGSVSV